MYTKYFQVNDKIYCCNVILAVSQTLLSFKTDFKEILIYTEWSKVYLIPRMSFSIYSKTQAVITSFHMVNLKYEAMSVTNE